MKRSRVDAFFRDCAIDCIAEQRAYHDFCMSYDAGKQDMLIHQLLQDYIEMWQQMRRPRSTVTLDTICTLNVNKHGWMLIRDDTGDVLFAFRDRISPRIICFHGNSQKHYFLRNRAWMFAPAIAEEKNINHVLTTDTILNIFQFLPLWFILSSCRYVSKQWAEWSKHDKLWNIALGRLKTMELYSPAWKSLSPMQQVIGHTFMSWPPAKREELHAPSKSLIISRARSIQITRWSLILRRGMQKNKPIFMAMLTSVYIQTDDESVSFKYNPDPCSNGMQMSIDLHNKPVLKVERKVFRLRFYRDGKWVVDGVSGFWRPFWCPFVEEVILKDVSEWWGKKR